jgi:peptide/nickel transport system substrate-binding protein
MQDSSDSSPDSDWRGSRRLALERTAAVAAALSTGGALSPVAQATRRRVSAKKNVVTVAFSDTSLKDSLDPAIVSNTLTAAVGTAIYEPLVALDANFRPVPAMAESFRYNKALTEWTFRLRKARWGDGRPVTAQDAVYSLQRLLDKKLGSVLYAALSPFLTPQRIRALDSRTIRLSLTAPNAFLIDSLADRHACIIPNHTVKFPGIGSGAYRAKSFKAGQGFELERNPYYWNQNLPLVDSIRGIVIPDQASKLQAVLHGSADIGDAIEYGSLATIRNNRSVKPVRVKDMISYRILFDPYKEPYTDNRVRQALKLAANRQEIVQLVFQGFGSVSYDTPIPPSDPTVPKGIAIKQNIPRAKELLAAAGHPNGIEGEIWTSQAFAGMVDLAVVYAKQAAAAGIRLDVKQAPPDTYWNQYGDKPASISYWSTRPPYPSLALEFLGPRANNESKFENARFDAILKQLPSIADPKRRTALFREANTVLATTSGTILPAFGDFVWVTKASITGLSFGYTWRPDFRRVRFAS